MNVFNRLVDSDHLLRPFRLERVTLEQADYQLAATLGHRDVATTMIYTHVLNRGPAAVRSPLDPARPT